MITLRPVRSTAEVGDAKLLCREYLDWLQDEHGISLDFQGVEQELSSLPGEYAPPMGELVVAYDANGQALGCIALRPFATGVCEIKRLYVRPEARGQGLAHRLVSQIVELAIRLGYRRAVLDTGSFMAAAQRVYDRAGFIEIPAYYDNPLPGITYLGRDFDGDDGAEQRQAANGPANLLHKRDTQIRKL